MSTESEATCAASTVESIKTVKIPPFWQSDPTLWFTQVEAQFHTCNIKTDSTKYYTVIAALDCSVLQQVSDLLRNPPDTKKYETLKEHLISVFADSDEKRLKKLLTELELGDQRPSQLLRYMKTLAAEKVSESLLKTLWLQRMPTQVQMVLSASEGVELTKMAEIADKIVQVSLNGLEASNIASVACAQEPARSNQIPPSIPTAGHEIALLQQQIGTLTKMVEELRMERGRPKFRPRTHARSRSRPRTPSNNGDCFYHRRFGAKARKCTSPCSYNTSGNDSSRRQ